jgi:dihydrofolate reductase
LAKLVEATHVTLGGEIASPDAWARPYLDAQHGDYANALLRAADALVLGRLTYEGLASAYQKMAEEAGAAPSPFVTRMNEIPKFVASRTLRQTTWNATIIEGDVADYVTDLKHTRRLNLLKYGSGPLDNALMDRKLVDEFHLFITPVAVGRGTHLFESIDWAPHLDLIDVTRFESGVVVLVYAPK